MSKTFAPVIPVIVNDAQTKMQNSEEQQLFIRGSTLGFSRSGFVSRNRKDGDTSTGVAGTQERHIVAESGGVFVKGTQDPDYHTKASDTIGDAASEKLKKAQSPTSQAPVTDPTKPPIDSKNDDEASHQMTQRRFDGCASDKKQIENSCSNHHVISKCSQGSFPPDQSKSPTKQEQKQLQGAEQDPLDPQVSKMHPKDHMVGECKSSLISDGLSGGKTKHPANSVAKQQRKKLASNSQRQSRLDSGTKLGMLSQNTDESFVQKARVEANPNPFRPQMKSNSHRDMSTDSVRDTGVKKNRYESLVSSTTTMVKHEGRERAAMATPQLGLQSTPPDQRNLKQKESEEKEKSPTPIFKLDQENGPIAFPMPANPLETKFGTPELSTEEGATHLRKQEKKLHPTAENLHTANNKHSGTSDDECMRIVEAQLGAIDSPIASLNVVLCEQVHEKIKNEVVSTHSPQRIKMKKILTEQIGGSNENQTSQMEPSSSNILIEATGDAPNSRRALNSPQVERYGEQSGFTLQNVPSLSEKEIVTVSSVQNEVEWCALKGTRQLSTFSPCQKSKRDQKSQRPSLNDVKSPTQDYSPLVFAKPQHQQASSFYTASQLSAKNKNLSLANDSLHQIFDVMHNAKLGSLIEEEMTFDELSSKLGGLQAAGQEFELQRSDQKTQARASGTEMCLFNDLNSSARISVCSQPDSFADDSNRSQDFQKLPALLQSASRPVAVFYGEHPEECRGRFDYENRLFNHFNVNKMTADNQVFANMKQGSFAENLGDKVLPDYTGGSDNVSPLNFKQQHLVTPLKAVESQTLLKNLETPRERSDLYAEFEMNHDVLLNTPSNGACFGDEVQRQPEQAPATFSEKGDTHDQWLEATAAFEGIKPHQGPVPAQFQDRAISTQLNSGKRVFDLSKDSSRLLSERFAQILDCAAAGSTIRLPAREFEVATLVVKKHCKIEGQPGTIIHFKSSSLTIDTSLDHTEDRDFRHEEPVVFSQIQFNFSIDLRSVASTKFMVDPKTRAGADSLQKLFKVQQMQHSQSRTLVQLISIKTGSKAEFRDCSFRCDKLFLPRLPQTVLSPTSDPKQPLPSCYSSQRSLTAKRSVNPQQEKDTHDSMSVGRSDRQLNDSQMVGSASGRILGKYFANEKEEERMLRENVHEICFWLNGEAMNENPACLHEFNRSAAPRVGTKALRNQRLPYKGSLLLQSCVMTGFYNQVRAGCNASIEIDQCYMQDSKSSALMLVNPCYFRMAHSNLIRTQINSGVNIRWLSDSIDKHVSRVIDIQQNDLGLNHFCGVEIQGNLYGAHNLKIDISRNFVYRNKKEGILIQNLALTNMLLYGNELAKNEGDNIKISHVHHKVNKSYAFRIEDCHIEHSKGGFGANLYDTSVVFKNCFVKGNQSGGLFCGCPEKPASLLPDALCFLKKFPMSIKISGCEVTQNMHYGVLVQDFWKGSVIIKKSLIQLNCNFGVYIHAKEPPKEDAVNKQLHQSMNQNLQSLDLKLNNNEDQSAQLFKVVINRRGTLPGQPSVVSHNPFNTSALSQGRPDAVSSKRRSLPPFVSNSNRRGSLKKGAAGLASLQPGGTSSPNLINLQRVAMPGTEAKVTIEEALESERCRVEDGEQVPTMRNLMTTQHSELLIGANARNVNFNTMARLSVNQATIENAILDSQLRESPIGLKQNSVSLASSIVASLRRKTKTESSARAKRNSASGREELSNNNEISRQVTAQLLHHIDFRLILEKQELGKVYIISGTGIIKNGGAGVAIRHCYLEIDAHPKTRVQDNDFGYQVYVMLKQCQRLLTGFEQAILEHRIRGRKVLVGGGWGQITPAVKAGCCRTFFKYVCSCSRASNTSSPTFRNKVMDAPGIQFVSAAGHYPTPTPEQRRISDAHGGGANTPDLSPNKARFNTVTIQSCVKGEQAALIAARRDETRGSKKKESLQAEASREAQRKCSIF